MTIASGNDFVAALAELQLLEPDKLYKVQRAQQSQPADARTIASHLLKQGWLTAYQAEMLLAGRGEELLAPPPPEPLPPPAVRTVLVSRRPAQPPPERPSRRALWLALIGGCVLVAGLAVAIVLFVNKASDGGRASADKDSGGNGKDQIKDPEEFIDENFVLALRKGLNVPEGWEGEALRVVKANEDPCLEVSKQDGVAFATLPHVKLSGDFFIVAAYSLPPNHELTLRLQDRENSSQLKLVVQPNGSVVIAKDTHTRPPNYKPYQLSKLLLTRKGRQLNGRLTTRQSPPRTWARSPSTRL
jgi:hypothetical protein